MILYSQWTDLPINIRHKIANVFGITKKGSTHVVDNEIQSDGYSIKDIEKGLSVEVLQKYLDTTETSLQKLWDELIYRATNPTEVRVLVSDFVVTNEPVVSKGTAEVVKKGGRPKGSKNKIAKLKR